MSVRPLAQLYLPHRSADDAARQMEPGVLEAELVVFVSTAQVAWPKFSIPVEEFLAYAAARLPACPEAVLIERAGDLFLACGCAQGLPAAFSAFEQHHLSLVPAIVARIDSSREFGAEVQGALRHRLLSPGSDGSAPRIASYTGRGSLSGWVRIAALRLALNERRGRRRRREDLGEVLLLPALGDDAELDYIRNRYREDFEHALRDSLATLTPEDRNLLHLRFYDGVGSGRLAALWGIDRSTVIRRLQIAREEVFSGMRRRLKERLRIDSQEFDSLLRLLRANFDISLNVLVEEG